MATLPLFAHQARAPLTALVLGVEKAAAWQAAGLLAAGGHRLIAAIVSGRRRAVEPDPGARVTVVGEARDLSYRRHLDHAVVCLAPPAADPRAALVRCLAAPPRPRQAETRE
jgi:hypothetical protein